MDERAENLINLLEDISKHLGDLQDSNQRFREVLGQSRVLRSTVMNVGKNFSEQLQDGHAGLTEMLKMAVELSREVGTALPGGPSKVSPDDLAKRFQSIIENSQLEARQPKAGGVAATLKSMDVELKGFVVVEGGETHIVTPAPTRTADAAQLSTIRMSFGTVPVVRTRSPVAPEAPVK